MKKVSNGQAYSRLIVACAMSLAAPVAWASSDETLDLGNLEAAIAYDYCAWAYDDGVDPSYLPEVSVIVVEAGMRVARESSDKRACEKTLSTGRKLVSSIRKQNRRRIRKQARFKKSRDDEIAAVQEKISALWIEDQLARIAYVQTQTDSRTNSRFWAHRIATAEATAVDEESARYVQGLLSDYDWIDIPRFTRSVSQQAWTLVQHADDYLDLQKLALSRMEPYLATGGVLRRNYAYLWDRVAVNSGELQRYGTQPDWGSCEEGMLTLMPMEDPEMVDKRRADMQLGPVKNDLDQMSRQTCG